MTESVAPTVSDVIVAFKRAEEKAGFAAAMNVVRQFGAQYVATIPIAHYEAAIHQFTELALGQSTQGPTRAATSPKASNASAAAVKVVDSTDTNSDQPESESDRIKAAWKKKRDT